MTWCTTEAPKDEEAGGLQSAVELICCHYGRCVLDEGFSARTIILHNGALRCRAQVHWRWKKARLGMNPQRFMPPVCFIGYLMLQIFYIHKVQYMISQ